MMTAPYNSYTLSFPFLFYWLFLQDENDSDAEDDNWPELRYGIYKNPKPGPSWRVEPGEYYNPALPTDSN